jgi:predicted MFS family arabinose efflux permease
MPLALFPAINAQRFGGDPRTLGLMLTAIGVGGLVGAVLSGPLAHVSRPGLAMLVCVFGSGLAFAAFAVAPGPWPTLLTLAVVGAVDGFTVALRGTIVQMVTTPVISAFAGGVACAVAIVAIGVALPGLARYRLPQGLLTSYATACGRSRQIRQSTDVLQCNLQQPSHCNQER